MADIYHSGLTEELEITVDDVNATVDNTKVCLRQGNYNNCRTSALSYSDGKWAVNFANLKGTYQIIILEGYLTDKAGNKSTMVMTDEFTVSNEKDTIGLTDINYETGIYNKGGTDYYLFDVFGSKSLNFNIYAGANNYVGNACDYIKFYNNSGVETDVFKCIAGDKNITIVYNTQTTEVVDLVNGYYFVVSGAAIKGANTLDSIDYNSNSKIRLLVNPALVITKSYNVSESNMVIETIDNIVHYYIKGARSVNVTFRSNVYIDAYTYGGNAFNGVKLQNITLTGLVEGIEYSVELIDYLGSSWSENFIVHFDNKAPVVDIELDEFTNTKEVVIGYVCSDTGDDRESTSSSGMNCADRILNVYANNSLLVLNEDYTYEERDGKDIPGAAH